MCDNDPFLNLLNIQHNTPYFVFNADLVVRDVNAFKAAMPENIQVYYAMKSNSERAVLETLHNHGVNFEVASVYELEMLRQLNVAADRIIYGTAVKPFEQIKSFADYGVDRFAFDSSAELERIAQAAPGSKVYLRVLVEDNADSVFTMSEKFGVPKQEVVDLLVKAKDLGLDPYGLSFNVGSQARNADAWANGVNDLVDSIVELEKQGIRIQVLNLGGGFPYHYVKGDAIPDIHTIGKYIKQAITNLPYEVELFAEPGRNLVAAAYCLVVGVFAKNTRPNGKWLYVDAGAYNALLEVMAYQGSIRYNMEVVSESSRSGQLVPYIVTGPTGDSLDVIATDIMLPEDIEVGDRLIVRDVGAYSFTLTTPFNGFPKPPTYS